MRFVPLTVFFKFFLLLTVLVHCGLALVVLTHSRTHHPGGPEGRLLDGRPWAFATLIGGVFVAIAYWSAHRSALQSYDQAEKP